MKTFFILFGLIVLNSVCLSSCRTIISNKKNISLPPSLVIFTFDDGPNERYNTTERLLDILHKYQIKGVFCLLGENAENNPEIVRRIYNEGHIIVNHGYSDRFAIFMNKEEFMKNLYLGERAITEALGFKTNNNLYRPQGGFFTTRQQRIINEEGYTIITFTIPVLDPFVSYRGKDRLIKRIVRSVERRNGGIILLHDRRAGTARSASRLQRKPDGVFNRSWIPEAVEAIIIQLMDRGFILNETFLDYLL